VTLINIFGAEIDDSAVHVPPGLDIASSVRQNVEKKGRPPPPSPPTGGCPTCADFGACCGTCVDSGKPSGHGCF